MGFHFVDSPGPGGHPLDPPPVAALYRGTPRGLRQVLGAPDKSRAIHERVQLGLFLRGGVLVLVLDRVHKPMVLGQHCSLGKPPRDGAHQAPDQVPVPVHLDSGPAPTGSHI
eukprot:2584641-Pyramimonas_sp.AAC.1